VSNNGDGEETFTLELRDETENKLIASRQVTLAAGEATTVNIDWDTTGATGGPAPGEEVVPPAGTVHMLTATATLAGDTMGSNNSMSLVPGIWVIAAPIASEIEFPEGEKFRARKTGDLASETPPIDTEVTPLAEVYVGPVESQGKLSPSAPAISTASIPLSRLFRAGDLIEEEGYLDQPDINTFAAQDEPGTIRGRIKLEGRTSSLGSYVEVGRQATFADQQGHFLIQRPAGNFDLSIKAPGYLSLEIYNLNVDKGEELVVPVVTLPFGDADGNGVIDIYDLTVAAGNYSRTAADLRFR